MAIWQFVVGLVPARWCAIDGNGPDLLVDSEGYSDLGSAWREYQPDARFVSLISEILPASPAWHEDLMCWGDDTLSAALAAVNNAPIENRTVLTDAVMVTLDNYQKQEIRALLVP